MDAMAQVLTEKGYALEEVISRLGSFGAPAELFKRWKPFNENGAAVKGV